MHSKPLVVFCLYKNNNCLLSKIIAESAACTSPHDGDDAGIAARILRINDDKIEREAWVRVSGSKESLNLFEQLLRRANSVRYQLIYDAYYSKVYRIIYPKQLCCGKCPLLRPIIGAMVKTVVATPNALIVEYIVSKSSLLKELKREGCRVLLSHPIDEMDYLLTQRQEYVLLYAYLRGYYSYPRKVSLKDLAKELGMAVSTLAELLRKAEAKVMEAFIRHELPHYIVKRYLMSRMKPEYSREVREVVEENLPGAT